MPITHAIAMPSASRHDNTNREPLRTRLPKQLHQRQSRSDAQAQQRDNDHGLGKRCHCIGAFPSVTRRDS